MYIKKNDIIQIEITGVTAECSGVGRFDGMAVFIPAAAVGDILSVKILKVAKNYAFGKIESIITPSEDRISLDCPQFLKCGGCVFRHISYSSELKAKEQRVRDAIKRIGGFDDIDIRPIVGADSCNNYRNKAQLPIGVGKDGKITMGFFANHSHRIVECFDCSLQSKEFGRAINVFKAWADKYSIAPYNEANHTGVLRHLYLRIAQATGEIMVCVVANSKNLPHENELINMLKENVPNLASIILNVNTKKTNVITGDTCRTLWGKDYITDELCGLRFNISPLSFYQVNRVQAQRLYQIANKYASLTKEDTLLDLYCGTGTIGLTMANQVKELIGVEIIEQAVENAYENAKLNNIKNARFICSDASKAACDLKQQNISPNIIVIDPPRKGCDASLIDTIISMEPDRIVYISCDPATLARDLKIFNEKGYKPQALTPVDLFPRTAHVECVTFLRRK